MTLVSEKTSTNGQEKTQKPQAGPVKVRVTLTSRGNGILMNPMTDDTLDELAGVKSKAVSEKEMPLEDRAKKRVIKNAEGKIGLPATYILAALIAAGRHVKNGKDKISTAVSTTLYEFLTVEDEFFPFSNQSEPMIVDKRRGVLNNAGKSVAVAIVRPKFKNWEIVLDVTVDTSVMSTEVVRKIFEAAGSKIGVADFRPAKKGPFGMFSVTNWEIVQ